ncbi:hypothetical protein [Sphingobacterium paucimobilis]|uniref:Uncharacterized protein n=1 Tax=Sphingobacterium paucimobilis HER1398 TaxID=1346330 RepID=U2J4V2_9SPHI|nr:hypothetical protein [Sphingobacterium paucimobilis]ERJ57688.1 hypothetical protein M472_02805 [Sphingobacterium paucimobilis HER1398]
MENLKRNWLKAIMGLTLMLGLMFVINERTVAKEETEAKQAPTTYYYNGPSASLATNIMVASNWSTTQAPQFTCEDDQNLDVPCSLQVPAGKTISQHLTDLGNLSAVEAATSTRRAE